MITAELPPDILDGFEYRNAENVLKKLDHFALSGLDAMHVVADFDLTLTAGKQPGQNAGTWDVMDELMPPDGVERHAVIYKSFRPLELAGKLDSKITAEKWAETLDLITSYPMNIADIEAAFLSVAMLRDGAKDLFDACDRAKVPTVILSSGIKNVIELVAQYYDIHPSHILSNDLTVDATGQVTGWNRETLIHMLNKKEMGHGELSKLRSERPNVLLLGDVPDDTRMVEGDDVVRIRVLDPKRGESHSLDIALQASFDTGFDLVVEHSLRPVTRLMRYFAKVG